MNKSTAKVASFKAHKDKRILVYEMKEDELEFAKKIITRRYRAAVDYNKWRASCTLKPLYGKSIVFADRVTTEVTYRIKEMINETGKDISEIAEEFREYLGYRTVFFREENGKRIPIDSQRIMKAYKAMQSRQPVKIIENLLFY